MEEQPKEFTPEEKANARSQAEKILAESKASKKNFPMGSPMSEKEYVEWYIKNKEERTAIDEKFTPKERVMAFSRAQAEMTLAEMRANGLTLKFPTTEKDWIDNYVEAQTQLWTVMMTEMRKDDRRKVPMLRWDSSKWSLGYDWEDEPPQWGTARSKVE